MEASYTWSQFHWRSGISWQQEPVTRNAPRWIRFSVGVTTMDNRSLLSRVYAVQKVSRSILFSFRIWNAERDPGTTIIPALDPSTVFRYPSEMVKRSWRTSRLFCALPSETTMKKTEAFRSLRLRGSVCAFVNPWNTVGDGPDLRRSFLFPSLSWPPSKIIRQTECGLSFT